jgi:hypothetical protein
MHKKISKKNRERKRRPDAKVHSADNQLNYSAADILQKIATVFGVSVDHIVIDEADRLVIHVRNQELFKRFLELDRFRPEELESIMGVLDTFIRVRSAKETFKDS